MNQDHAKFSKQVRFLKYNPTNIDKMTDLFEEIDTAQCYEYILMMMISYPTETISIYENSVLDYNIKKWNGIFMSNVDAIDIMSNVRNIIYSTEHGNKKLSLLIKQIIDTVCDKVMNSVISDRLDFVLGSKKDKWNNLSEDISTDDENSYSDYISRSKGLNDSSSGNSSDDSRSLIGSSADDEKIGTTFYKHCDIEGNCINQYETSTAKQAASVAFSNLVTMNKKKGVETMNTNIILQKEDEKIFIFTAERIQLNPPEELTIRDRNGGPDKKITYRYRNKIMKTNSEYDKSP